MLIISQDPFISQSSPYHSPQPRIDFHIMKSRDLFSYLCLQVFQEDCWTNGACLESVMTNQILAESTFACEDLCRQSPDCVWFTHYLDKGLCVLLSECVQLKPIPETISGQSKCGGVDQCEITGKCLNSL